MAAALKIGISGRRTLALLFAAFIALASTLSLAAGTPTPHRLTGDTQSVDLLTSAWRLEDISGAMGPRDVSAARERGEMRPLSALSVRDYGVRLNRATWFAFDVSAQEQGDWVVEITRPETRLVRLYMRAPGGDWADLGELGGSLPYSARPVPHRNFLYPVKLGPGITSFQLRVQTEGPAETGATLWRPAGLLDHDMAFLGFSWLFFGICGAMLVYNLLLYVMVRDRGYMLYVAGIATAVFGYLGQSGLGAQYIFPDTTWWSGRFMALGWSASAYFRVALARHFLSTRERLPWADRVLEVTGWAALVTCVVLAVAPRSISGVFMIVLSIGSSLFLDFVSILAVIKRWPGAPYYCASWMTLSVGVVVTTARYFAVLPTNVLTLNSLALAAALSYILLSIALAHQINMEKRLKELAQSRTLAILSASQALGVESRLDLLHARVRDIVSSLTGATHVRLVLWDPDLKAWFLLGTGPEGGRVLLDEAAAQERLPVSVVRHVDETGEVVLVADALRDPRFAADAAFQDATQCSVLALPIAHHGAAQAILVLENRSASGVFSTSDVQTLATIAGPLAVSVENALLYERLEQRVAEQTRELRETQQQLISTARRAGMAEIATNVLHNMGNILNSVNVEADLLRSRLHESRLSGVARLAALMDENAGDPVAFMKSDKGRLLPGYLRELGEVLQRERAEMLDRIGRLASSVEHIKNVVATQQAFAGSSVFTEKLLPAELVDEALRMTGDSLRRHRVEVMKEVEELAPVVLDKTRALQILVNLITNARQALEGVAEGSRALHVRMSAEEGLLRIRVRDWGCGIAPENLSRIFSHGFTTRRAGHGFGLHSSALAAGEMGGRLTVHSDGPGTGATFTLDLPLKPA